MGFAVDTSGTLETNLVLYAQFNESSGTTTTAIVSNRQGALQSGTAFAAGKLGNGVQRTTAGEFVYFNVGNTSPAFTVTNNFSMAIWVKPNATPTWIAFLISPGGGGEIALILLNSSLTVGAYYGGAELSSGTTLSSGVFSHVCLVRAAGITKFFINGVQASNTYTNTPSTPTSFPFFGGGNNFIGVLDEGGYWTKALTQQEITDLYNGGAGNVYAVSNGSPEITIRRIMMSEP